MSLFSDVFSLPVHFEFFATLSYCSHFAKFVCLLETAEIETGIAEKWSMLSHMISSRWFSLILKNSIISNSQCEFNWVSFHMIDQTE
jgi:hypothetical protein